MPSLDVVPASIETSPGDTVEFSVRASQAIAASVAWTATGGTISDDGRYVAGLTEGNYRVIARAESGVADTAIVSIHSDPTPVSIEVTPASVALSPGDSVRFHAELRAADGRQVNDSIAWSATGGDIDAVGLYRAADTPGIFTVRATAGSLTATARVEVAEDTPAAASIEVSPQTAELEPGENVQFSAVLRSAGGAVVGGVVHWSAEGGSIDSQGVFTAGSQPGSYVITASSEDGLEGDATVTIAEPPTAVEISIEPGNAELEPGSSLGFTYVMTSSSGGPIGGPAEWSATGGSVSGDGMYQAPNEVGQYLVIVSCNDPDVCPTTLRDTANVSVVSPAYLTNVVVDPREVSLRPGEAALFVATAYDQFGHPFDAQIGWSASGGSIDPAGRFVAGSEAGTFPIVATASATVRDTAWATIEVVADTMELVFEDGFESGNHHSWQDPDPLNGAQGTVPIDFTTTERSRTGSYGYRFYGIESGDPLTQQYGLSDLDRISVKLLHWGPWSEGGPHVYSAWYYWPSEYAVHEGADKYTNIMQWKGRGRPDWNPTWVVAVDGYNGHEDRIVLHDWNGRMTGQQIHLPQPIVTVPKDRWFNLKVLYDPDWTDGMIKVWLDGELIISREDVATLVQGYQDRDLMWGVGNYGWAALGPDGDTSRGFYVDDIRVWKVSP